jgi:hypothetical protein
MSNLFPDEFIKTLPAYLAAQLTEVDKDTYVVDASDLLLPVGVFPVGFKIHPANGKQFGNGYPFILMARGRSENIYRQAFGSIIIHLHND